MRPLVLLILTAFCTLSAIAGFVYLTLARAPGWSPDCLQGSPSHSYEWPGVILLTVVGGTQLLAFVFSLSRRSSGRCSPRSPGSPW